MILTTTLYLSVEFAEDDAKPKNPQQEIETAQSLIKMNVAL